MYQMVLVVYKTNLINLR